MEDSDVTYNPVKPPKQAFFEDVDKWYPEDFAKKINQPDDWYLYGMDLETYNKKKGYAEFLAEKVPMYKTWESMKEDFPEVTAEEYLRYKERKRPGGPATSRVAEEAEEIRRIDAAKQEARDIQALQDLADFVTR